MAYNNKNCEFSAKKFFFKALNKEMVYKHTHTHTHTHTQKKNNEQGETAYLYALHAPCQHGEQVHFHTFSFTMLQSHIQKIDVHFPFFLIVVIAFFFKKTSFSKNSYSVLSLKDKHCDT